MRREPHVRFCESGEVRFLSATHLVVLTESAKDASRAMKDVERLLRGRGLELNREKTRIVAPGEDLVFLGVTVRASNVAQPANGEVIN